MIRSCLLALLRVYQYLVSPWMGGACRYWPTCSEYAREAVQTQGVLKGVWLAVCRLARCHPYGRGGVDPVPTQFSWRCVCGGQHTQTRDQDAALHTALDLSGDGICTPAAIKRAGATRLANHS